MSSTITLKDLRRFLKRVREGQHYFEGSWCWVWTGRRTKDGYGQFRLGERTTPPIYTHRLAYAIWNGPLEYGKDVHHACDNRACCNPLHLVQVDSAPHRAETLNGAGKNGSPY